MLDHFTLLVAHDQCDQWSAVLFCSLQTHIMGNCIVICRSMCMLMMMLLWWWCCVIVLLVVVDDDVVVALFMFWLLAATNTIAAKLKHVLANKFKDWLKCYCCRSQGPSTASSSMSCLAWELTSHRILQVSSAQTSNFPCSPGKPMQMLEGWMPLGTRMMHSNRPCKHAEHTSSIRKG